MICPYCKNRIEGKTLIWCPKCGYNLLSEAASEAQPPQAVSASASCSAASASEARTNEADTSSRSARESGLAAATEEVIRWAQATLTGLNVGDVKSGSLLHLKLREVMIAYRIAKAEPPDAPPAVGERALARNATR